MYCPKCSQQQVSEDLRYCSRCGFPLTGVALVLENDGLIPQLAAKDAPRRRGKIMKESLVLTLACWMLVVLGTATWDWGGSFEISREGRVANPFCAGADWFAQVSLCLPLCE